VEVDRDKAARRLEVAQHRHPPANPLEVVVASSAQGKGILGDIDGFSPKGVESSEDKIKRKKFLRKIGYKLG
jgi:adenosine/AMP kinase